MLDQKDMIDQMYTKKKDKTNPISEMHFYEMHLFLVLRSRKVKSYWLK